MLSLKGFAAPVPAFNVRALRTIGEAIPTPDLRRVAGMVE
jgi:hypothetical protein